MDGGGMAILPQDTGVGLSASNRANHRRDDHFAIPPRRLNRLFDAAQEPMLTAKLHPWD
jgi:hypothetical protein